MPAACLTLAEIGLSTPTVADVTIPFEGLELPAASAKPQPEPPHSVLTIGLIDRDGEPTHEAVNRVLSFLAERLR